MKKSSLLLVLVSVFSVTVFAQKPKDIRKELQTKFIMAEEGDTIHIPAGRFVSSATLSLDEKKNIVVKGAGIDKTFISYKGQSEGAEGIRVSNSENITLMGLSVQDAKGDGIKVIDTKGITFYEVRTEWTGRAKKTNGAYGLYPVSSENVMIDKCEAIGASDAGIYVGQSHNIIVRNSRAYRNVAGIEIENSTMADVYNCEATGNTGGILVFDLPDLPKKKGGNVRVYNNKVWENNYKNFAPKGNIVAGVPPGTGIIILATNDVEVYDNQIINNRTSGLSISSYFMTENEIKDKDYYPYPSAIYVHDNTFERKRMRATLKNKIGILFNLKFGKDVPDIIYDGIVDPKSLDANGQVKEDFQICIRNNKNARFGNLDAENDFENLNYDLAPFDCERKSLASPSLSSLDD